MKTKKQKSVLFHITGGGGNNNKKTCLGLIDKFDPDYFGINWFLNEETDEVTNESGNFITTFDEMHSEVGTFDLDGDYNTYGWCPLSDLSEIEFSTMINDLSPYEYKEEIIENGVDFHLFCFLEKNNLLKEYVEDLFYQTSFEDFIDGNDEIIKYSRLNDAFDNDYYQTDSYEVNKEFYFINKKY